MKEPITLTRSNTGEVLFYCCGTCGLFCGKDEEYARHHCGGHPCNECGEPSDPHRILCKKCISKKENERFEEKKSKAKKVCADEYHGPVYWDEMENYYECAGEAWEAIQDEFVCDIEGAKQATIWACDRSNLVIDDADEIIINALENQEHHEEAYDSIPQDGIKEFQDFCKQWNEEYGTLVESWFPNNDLIVFPESWWTKYLEEVEEVHECGS